MLEKEWTMNKVQNCKIVKNRNFRNFQKMKNGYFKAKNLCDKSLTIKNLDFSMPFVIVYSVFSLDAVFMEKFVDQNHLF